MREICLSGSMSGERKRSVAAWPKLPRLSSTLPFASKLVRAKTDLCLLLPSQLNRSTQHSRNVYQMLA